MTTPGTNADLVAALREVASPHRSRPSAAELVGQALRTQIIDGHLRPGTRLTEETIAQVLGYSRNTIRESFALLAAERLVLREPNRGVFVATPNARDVRDIYATRRLIEPAAVEHGIGCTPERVSELRGIVDSAHDAAARGDLAAVAQGNQELHRTITAMSGSTRTTALMEDVLAEMRLVFHTMQADPRFHLDFLVRNEEIVATLERGDRVAAANLLRDYLDAAEDRLLTAPSGPSPTDTD